MFDEIDYKTNSTRNLLRKNYSNPSSILRNKNISASSNGGSNFRCSLQDDMLSQLINHHTIGEQKRKAIKELKPGESYNQAKLYFNKRKNSLEMETQNISKVKINQAIQDSLKWNRDLRKSRSPVSSRLRRSHDKLLTKKEQYHRSLRSLSNASHGVESQNLISIKRSKRSVKFSVHSSQLSYQSLPRNETNGCHNAQRKSHQSRVSTKSQQSQKSQKSRCSSKQEYFNSIRNRNKDFSFSNQ